MNAASPGRVFCVVAIAQALSLFGSGLTAFAVGVTIFERTASTAQFGLFGLCATLPAVVASPIVGVLIDRVTPRSAMIAGQCAAAAATLGLAAVVSASSPPIAATCALVCAVSVFESIAWTAYLAALHAMVRPGAVDRANGFVQLGDAAATILAPVAAAAMLEIAPIRGVLACDAATSLVAAASLALVPRTPRARPDRPARAIAELRDALRFLGDRRGLCALATVFTVSNFALSAFQALAPPLLIVLGGRASAAAVRSLAGIGMVAGGLMATALPAPRRKARATALWAAARGAVLAATLVHPSVSTLAIVAFVAALSFAPTASYSQSIWQTHVPASMQGRVFALRRAMATASIPIAYGAMGLLAERAFAPALLAVVGATTAVVAVVVGSSRAMRALDESGVEIVDTASCARRAIRR